MSPKIFISLATAVLPLSFAWGAAAGGTLSDGADTYGPSCDLRVVHDRGSIVLEGHVFASVPVSGSYELEISQGSHTDGSDIRQGGDFEVIAGMDGSLGIVSLPARGGYAATLIVHWHDGAPDCTRRIGTGRRL